MKKFLCYDTKDVVSGKLNVNSNGVINPNSTVPSTNSAANQYLVTDGDGNVRWQDQLAYETSLWKDFILHESPTQITEFTMPSVGDTVTIKINGVESVETVKSAEVEELGHTYSYIGSVDIISINSGANGWCIACQDGQPACVGVSRPDTTVSLFVTEPHKIDEKYIPQDKDFIRPLSYYADGWHQFAIYYNESGDEAICYKCDNINVPGLHDEMFIDADVAQFIIGRILSKISHSFSASVCVLDPGNNEKSISRRDYIYGTDETEMTQLASMMGYTLTTKPTT